MPHGTKQAIVLSCTLALLAVPVLSQTPQSSATPQRATTTTPLVQQRGPSYEDLVAKARLLAAQKNFKDAVNAGEQAIQMDDKRWEGYVVSAEAYSGQQLYDDAIGMLQSALTRAPQEKKQLIRDAITETRKQLSAPQAAAAPPQAPAPAPAAALAQTPAPALAAPTQAEIVLWKSIENSKSAADYQGYLDAYPTGVYASVANRRLQDLKRPAEDAARANQRIKVLLEWVQDNQSRDPHAVRGNSPDLLIASDITSINGCVITNVTTTTIKGRQADRVESIDLRRALGSDINIIPGVTAWWDVRVSDPSTHYISFNDRAKAAEALNRLVEATQLCESLNSDNASKSSSIIGDSQPASGELGRMLREKSVDAPAAPDSGKLPVRAAPVPATRSR